ncbi:MULTISPECIES: response regulator [unclassified Variovorax]|uniref:response regulator transcription factor n=1 Tax=unclassified Variovorax TaxID=663243 RepID=UPI00076C6C1D|nr:MULTISPECIES: response regulator [unclassified Variovorax]KWT96939.1 Response regulator receiver [Variovorax sp. WDL1]PNG58493.1 Transcriptional regulatory protein PhoP [Variovorax sp. B4]PNG61717.1 Transcriptional regulatory protein PhoP [Variovorax sp. B2]VTV12231.1 DNA-binding transcriptional regulator PhoP [Variovorax sp. WDL1]
MVLVTFLVEDSATIRNNLIPTLADLGGARVVAFAEGEKDAVGWLTEHDGQWDLAIVDLFLKEGSGLGVLHGCRDRASHQRVVVLTNYPTAEIRRRCAALGADAVFDKSTEFEELFEFCCALGKAKPGAPGD